MSAPDYIPSIVAYLKRRLAEVNYPTPDIGIICGSGLGVLASTIENPFVIRYEEIKGFPRSTVVVCRSRFRAGTAGFSIRFACAQGHAGELVFGKIGGKNVVAMKGRFHFYEGYSPAQVC